MIAHAYTNAIADDLRSSIMIWGLKTMPQMLHLHRCQELLLVREFPCYGVVNE